MQAIDRQFETAEAELLETLDRVVSTLADAGVEGVLIGGIAVAALGRPRWTHDIDIMVRPEHALRALEALGGAGMETEQTDVSLGGMSCSRVRRGRPDRSHLPQPRRPLPR